VVTGPSVGSILAPIAFLGPDYDETQTQTVRKIAAVVDRHPLSNIGNIDLLGALWDAASRFPWESRPSCDPCATTHS
jgi:hypothetical protein